MDQAEGRTIRRPLLDRFEDKYMPEPNSGCWLWLASLRANGYGQVGRGGRGSGMELAHRAAYNLYVGPIPDGLVLDHLCRVRACVNPAHLEPVTNTENLRRGDHPNMVKARQRGAG